MLAEAERGTTEEAAANAKDIARTENREVKTIDTLHLAIVFIPRLLLGIPKPTGMFIGGKCKVLAVSGRWHG